MTLAEIQNRLRTPENRHRIRKITTPDTLAWPTFWMLVITLSSYVATTTLSLTGYMSLWMGGVINGLVGYLIFSVIHDSIHRAVSSNQKLNDLIGQVALIAFSPMVTLGVFRWGHIQHHRFASGEKDPDRYTFEGPRWGLPLRWMFIDAWYFIFVLRSGDKIAYKHLRQTFVAIGLTLSVLGALTWFGYGWAVFWLWFVANRITQLLLGFAFFWLPHEPHDTKQEDNFTRASAMRLGYEALFTPLLQYHNYHLIHHLFPRTPFYRHGEMWVLLEPELRKCDLAIQHGFAIKPTFYPGVDSAT